MRNDPGGGSSLGEEAEGHRDDTVGDEIPMEEVQLHEAGPSRPERAVTVEADPLPLKRGEFGYREPALPPVPDPEQAQTTLPERHPAERDAAVSDEAGVPAPPAVNAETASTHTNRSTSKRLLAKLKPKHVPLLKGVRITTILLLILQLLLVVGTIVGWVLVTNYLGKRSSSDSSNPNTLTGIGTTQIFVHVAFGIATLAEIIFVERRIYRVRAERWVHLHGPDLPMFGRRPGNQVSLGLAPWNRPPLPTYAAALAQSGVGTGDVEDNVIAVPPPPAYGNTRGSKLLLSGVLTDALREQRAQARAAAIARANAEGGSLRGSWRSGWSDESRPVSYVSHDQEWDERCDAARAARLEETLARLEDAHVRN